MGDSETKVGRRKTNKEFLQEVYDMVGDEYTVIGEYIKAREKIQIRHNTCGKEYMVLPNMFTGKGERCPYCKKEEGVQRKRKTHEEYIQQVHEVCGDEYLVLGKYTRGRDKILIKHKICGHAWEVRAQNFLDKTRCPKCAGNLKKTTETFTEEVERLNGKEYRVLSDYIDNKTKVKIYHEVCGTTYEVIPRVFFRGKKCPGCGKKSRNVMYA